MGLCDNNKTTKQQKLSIMLEKIKLSAYAIFAYLNIETEPFAILVILMILDTCLGAVKAVRFGQRFSFRLLIIGYSMKLVFLIIPLTVALMGKALGFDFGVVVGVTLSILSISELYSIFGSIYSIKNKKEVDKLDVVSELLATFRKMLKNYLDILMKKLTK